VNQPWRGRCGQLVRPCGIFSLPQLLLLAHVTETVDWLLFHKGPDLSTCRYKNFLSNTSTAESHGWGCSSSIREVPQKDHDPAILPWEYVVRQLSSRTRHRVLAVAALDKNLIWFDYVDISAFHSWVVDLWQSLSEWHLLQYACVLVCRRENVGAWIRVVNEHSISC